MENDNVRHKEHERSRRARPHDAVKKKHMLSLALQQHTPGTRRVLSQGVSWVTRKMRATIRRDPRSPFATPKPLPQ
jgi:hypothetical protein